MLSDSESISIYSFFSYFSLFLILSGVPIYFYIYSFPYDILLPYMFMVSDYS